MFQYKDANKNLHDVNKSIEKTELFEKFSTKYDEIYRRLTVETEINSYTFCTEVTFFGRYYGCVTFFVTKSGDEYIYSPIASCHVPSSHIKDGGQFAYISYGDSIDYINNQSLLEIYLGQTNRQ